MGRTIHYSFDLKTPLSVELQKKIMDITGEYNTKYTWTCENVGFSNLSYFPNWEYFKRLVGENFPQKDIWGMIDKEYKRLEKKGEHELDIMAHLSRKGFIKYHYGCDDKGYPNAQKFHGFTKTAGNEWNSLLVISYIVAISKLVPRSEISVHDEGEFLILPIKVKNGKARVDTKDILGSIAYWLRHDDNYFHSLIERTKGKFKDFGLNVSYEAVPFNARVCTRNWGGIKEYKREKHFRIKNIIVEGNSFRPVSDFCRKVNKADFDNHPQFRTMIIEPGKAAPAFTNVMAGFYGEYWNKNHERVELENEQRTNFIMNLLSGFAGKDAED